MVFENSKFVGRFYKIFWRTMRDLIGLIDFISIPTYKFIVNAFSVVVMCFNFGSLP